MNTQEILANDNFHVKLQLRIDWSELDTFGHVNNVSYFKYIQASRVNYMEYFRMINYHKETNTGPILASCKCDFKKPLYYPGQVIIFSRVEYIKNTSFCICHKLIDEKGEVVAEAQDILVMYDYNKNNKIPFPKELKAKIEKLENKKF